MTKIEDRYYQHDAIDSGKKLIIAPTASGKSVMIGMLADKVSQQYNKIAVVQHNADLLVQNRDAYKDLTGKRSGVYCASISKIYRNYKVVFGTIGSIKKIKHEFDCVIVDEAHKIGANSFKDFCKGKVTYGFTGTPFRDNGKTITPFFNNDYFLIPYKLMIDEGYILEAQIQPVVNSYNIKRVPDSNIKLIQLLNTRNETTKLILEEYLSKTDIQDIPNAKGMIFCVDLKHANFVKSIITDSVLVSSKMTTTQRKEIKKSGAKWYINVDCLTTGFDDKRIYDVVILRPTSSPQLYMQMIGRGIRKYEEDENKECRVFDFSDNAERFPPLKYLVEYYLDSESVKKTNAEQKKGKTCILCDFPMFKIEDFWRCGSDSCDYYEEVERQKQEESVVKNKTSGNNVVIECKDIVINVCQYNHTDKNKIKISFTYNGKQKNFFINPNHENGGYRSYSRNILKKIKRTKELSRDLKDGLLNVTKFVEEIACSDNKGFNRIFYLK